MKNKQEKQTGKVYCRYTVIDLQTGYALIYGEKWKDYYNLHMFNEYDGTFRHGLLFRKIIQYHRELVVHGRKCVLVFWVNAPIQKTASVVSSAGCIAGLQGKIYDNLGPLARFRALLWSFGYRYRKRK